MRGLHWLIGDMDNLTRENGPGLGVGVAADHVLGRRLVGWAGGPGSSGKARW